MRIIQSFAEFDEGSFYLKDNGEKKFLNFYSFLLSCLTLQKYYGNITMYCNQKAYDSFIRYIPYDNIEIVENNNTFEYWSYYKIDIMKKMTEKFIHVDSDVFIFDDLFSEFMTTDDYDVIIQDHLPRNCNMVANFVSNNSDFLIKNSIINPEIYDGSCAGCGTIGMTLEVKNDYVEICEKLKAGYANDELVAVNALGMILEELSLKLIILKQNLRVYEVLSQDLISTYGVLDAGIIRKYTHMWFGSKFDLENIKLMRDKIIRDFPQYKSLIEAYECEVLEKSTA